MNTDYRIKEQPKTVTVGTWKHRTGGIELCEAGSRQALSFDATPEWTLIRTETMEVDE